ANLAGVAGEVDVGEEIHLSAAHAARQVEGAAERRVLVAVDDADRYARGEQRQRGAEGRAVQVALARRATAVAQCVARPVTVAEAVLEGRALDDREVVRAAGPPVVEVAAGRRHLERDLVREARAIGARRAHRSGLWSGPRWDALDDEGVQEALRLQLERHLLGRLQFLERLAGVLRHADEREAHARRRTRPGRGRHEAEDDVALRNAADQRLELERATDRSGRRTHVAGLTDAGGEADVAGPVRLSV